MFANDFGSKFIRNDFTDFVKFEKGNNNKTPDDKGIDKNKRIKQNSSDGSIEMSIKFKKIDDNIE